MNNNQDIISIIEKDIINVIDELRECDTENNELTAQISKQKEELESQAQDIKIAIQDISTEKSASASIQSENNELLVALNNAHGIILDNENTNKKVVILGAKEKVMNHLSYRLGYLLVHKSKNILYMVLMPLLILSEYMSFQARSKDHKSIRRLRDYDDYQEAKKVMGYMSYKVGFSFIKNIKKPLGIFLFIIDVFKIRKNIKSGK